MTKSALVEFENGDKKTYMTEEVFSRVGLLKKVLNREVQLFLATE